VLRGGKEIDLVPVGRDHIAQEGDRIRFRIHLHERVVVDGLEPIILHDDAEYLAVSKPAGVDMTCNPQTGSVRHALMGMLQDMGYGEIYPAHRIDKPVSGIVCLGKNLKALSRLMRCVKRHAIEKTYIARVLAPLGPMPGGLLIDVPLKVVQEVEGRSPTARVAGTDGKVARTVLERELRRFDDGTALVEVSIQTGRLHQIRCHLQHAGYPIANDGEYGGQGELGREVYVDNDSGDLRSMLGDHHCKGCRSCKYFQFVLDGSERPPRLDPPIWLHSWKYKFPSLGLDFESPLPAWAQSSAQVESSGG